MNSEERILAILNSMMISIADLKINQIETNARLDNMESWSKSLEAGQASIAAYLSNPAVNPSGTFEKVDKLEGKVLRVEAGQTYMNRKIDLIAVEITKILNCIAAIQDGYNEQLKLISAEVEGLSDITKENMFALAKIKRST